METVVPTATGPKGRHGGICAGCICLVLVAGCAPGRTGTVDRPVRPANDVPARFVLDPADPDVAAGIPGQGCRTPLFDPRDGARLQLVRSAADLGDYEVPATRYGVARAELLRLRCATGEVVGIVGRDTP